MEKDIYSSEDLQYAVYKQLERCAMNNNLSRYEMIQGVVISPEPFTVQNKMLTNTQKQNREMIKKRFADQLDRKYKETKIRRDSIILNEL
jgi:long-subunit acyl-CoA synthetase (AMP-forming)